MKIVGFLQNAWSPLYAGGTWPRESWLKALYRSRSGQRLVKFENNVLLKNKDACIWWDNTTPIVGATPDSVVKPDYNHIINVLETQKPEVVITFGKQAERTLEKFSLDSLLLIAPHPACRVVTNLLYEELANYIHRIDAKKIKITETKDSINYLTLYKHGGWNSWTTSK